MEISSLWDKFDDMSKVAIQRAFIFARGRKATAVDLLIGIAQQNITESPLLQLMKSLNIPEQKLGEILISNRAEQYSSTSIEFEKSGFTPDWNPFERDPRDIDLEDAVQTSIMLAEKNNIFDDLRRVRIKDLFGVLLLEDFHTQAPLRKLLDSPKATFDQIKKAYREYLMQPENIGLPEFLAKRIPSKRKKPETPTIIPEPPPPSMLQVVSGFGADTRPNRDLVGIGAEVDAFAYLITARALQPPLAIGLFGDWGSGKTYFMKSLKERVYKITEQACQSHIAQKNISVYKHVVQIEFNAWHYVEGELWASLVEHIFEHLQTREKEATSLLGQRKQVWAQKLETKRRELEGIATQKKEKEDELVKNKQAIQNLEAERDNKLKDLSEWKAKDAIKDSKLLTEDDKKNLRKILRDLGVTGTYQSGLDFYNALSEMKTVLEEGSALGLVLRRRGWRWTAQLALVLISGPIISGLIYWLGQNQVPAVTNALLGVSGFLSTATIVLRQGTSELSKILQRVKSAQARLDEQRNIIEASYNDQISAIEEKLITIQARHQTACEKERTLNDDIAQLDAEAKQITNRSVMLDFIQEREGSLDYRKLLGLPALIRHDFDQLSDLINNSNKDFVQKDTGKKVDEEMINRIVLYIDDLDRCPPEKVAKVLQAVHLLLAFPLFVVVVAVDARWLSQSLQKYYRGLLAEVPERTTDHAREEISPRATPQDYLEKIFQVPFWVSSLSENARMSIVKGLVEDSLEELSTVSKQIKVPLISPEIGRKNRGKKVTIRPEVIQSAQTQIFYSPVPPQPLSVTPAGLDISSYELAFMEKLKPLLGLTPRSVRRFVNVYWLMKSIALALKKIDSFITEDMYADYQQVLFLLAVLTGLPNIAHDFFSMLCPRPLKGLDQAECTQKDLKGVINRLKEIIAQRSLEGNDSFAAERDLERLQHWANNYETGNWLTVPTARLSVWAPQVARFSYRMEHV